MTDADRALKRSCAHVLSQHIPVPSGDVLRGLAETPYAEAEADFYGEGGAVAQLEQRTAALLGKPAARFFIKGVTAQLCSLGAHIERAGTPGVVLHPQSHLDVDEANAIERVGGAKAIRLGRFAPFRATDLELITEPLAAVVVELPLRRAGYLLPPIEDLRAIAQWCRIKKVPLHLDGARLWEAAAGYGVTPADLAEFADTVYVSFYKGLGGLGGAILAGPDEHVRALSVWKTRFGGNLFTAFPQAIAALQGIDRHLPRMPAYLERARTLAAHLHGQIPAMVHPFPPATNAFQLIFEGSPAELRDRNRAFAEQRGVWLFNTFVEAPLAGRSVGEVVIGDAADTFDDAMVAQWLSDFCGAG